MSVMFITQSGRVLRNDEMTAADVAKALSELVEITGHELGFSSGAPSPTVFHVNTRYVVEWWDA